MERDAAGDRRRRSGPTAARRRGRHDGPSLLQGGRRSRPRRLCDDIFDKPYRHRARGHVRRDRAMGRTSAWIERRTPPRRRFWTACPRRSCRASRGCRGCACADQDDRRLRPTVSSIRAAGTGRDYGDRDGERARADPPRSRRTRRADPGRSDGDGGSQRDARPAELSDHLHSCDEAVAGATPFKVHWGPTAARRPATCPPGITAGMSRSIPRDLPATPRLDLLHGHLSSADTGHVEHAQGRLDGRCRRGSVVPVLRRSFRRQIGMGSDRRRSTSAGTTNQDHSQPVPGLSQRARARNSTTRPGRASRKSGGSDVHYYAWDRRPTNFQENGSGTSADSEDTHVGKDRALLLRHDGRLCPPHDFDAGNVASNLTPDITISNRQLRCSGLSLREHHGSGV